MISHLAPRQARRWQGRALAGALILGLFGVFAAHARGSQGAIELEDDEQQPLVLAHAAQRIVSLSPGATAMLFAAGAGQRIVGTSEYSDEPQAARAIERIGDSQGFDLERILALQPDVVVVWSGGTSSAQIARLQRVGLRIYRHRLARLDDLPQSLIRLGRLAGSEAQAQWAAAELSRRIGVLRHTYAQAKAATVLIQVWDRPIYTVGGSQLMTDVIHACGERSLYEDLTEPAPAVSLESVLARDPDIILALAPDQNAERDWLAAWRSYPSIKAVRNGQLIGWTDQRLSRLGPSILDASEQLCHRLRAGVSPPNS